MPVLAWIELSRVSSKTRRTVPVSAVPHFGLAVISFSIRQATYLSQVSGGGLRDGAVTMNEPVARAMPSRSRRPVFRNLIKATAGQSRIHLRPKFHKY